MDMGLAGNRRQRGPGVTGVRRAENPIRSLLVGARMDDLIGDVEGAVSGKVGRDGDGPSRGVGGAGQARAGQFPGFAAVGGADHTALRPGSGGLELVVADEQGMILGIVRRQDHIPHRHKVRAQRLPGRTAIGGAEQKPVAGGKHGLVVRPIG